jgi:3-oxoadipate enol-lactonase
MTTPTTALIAGAPARAELLRLDAPLSFWGGVDPRTGRIVDVRHPQHGACVAGRLLAMPGAIGSSSSSSVLLELARAGKAPAAILMVEPDAILLLGLVVAREMGWPAPPAARIAREAFARLSPGWYAIDGNGGVRLEAGMSELAGADERFRVRVDGPEGAPVLLMSHSLGCDLTMWDDVVPALARRYRVVRYDARGHGGSVVVDRPTSIAELADDALAVLDGLGVARAHFVGLSMGGMVGQWLLVHAPNRLDRVVLCNTAAHMPTPDMWNQRIAAARQGMDGLVESVMTRWFTPEFRAASPGKVARVAAVLRATAPEGYASCCAAIRDMDQRWSLNAARGDVTVLVGTRDPATTPAAGAFISETIPGARLASVEAAHISCVERPEDFAAAVLSALAAPARSARKAAAVKAAAPRPAPAARARPASAARRATPARAAARVAAGEPAAARASGKAVSKNTSKTAARTATTKKASPTGQADATKAAKKSVTTQGAAKKGAIKKGAIKKGPAKTGPAKTAPAKTGPAKTGPAKKGATRATARKTKAAAKAPARQSASKKNAVKKAPAKKAVAAKASARKTPATKAASKKGAARRSRES